MNQLETVVDNFNHQLNFSALLDVDIIPVIHKQDLVTGFQILRLPHLFRDRYLELVAYGAHP